MIAGVMEGKEAMNRRREEEKGWEMNRERVKEGGKGKEKGSRGEGRTGVEEEEEGVAIELLGSPLQPTTVVKALKGWGCWLQKNCNVVYYRSLYFLQFIAMYFDCYFCECESYFFYLLT